MLTRRFSDQEITRIREVAAVYECACPAQLGRQVAELRQLWAYQERCLNRTELDRQVHERICAALRVSHEAIEQALEEVLRLEGWDRERLEMPAALRERLLARGEPPRD